MDIPRGFLGLTARLGLKADADDFALVVADPERRATTSSAALFTRSRFAGPSVRLGRETVAGGGFDGFVVLSKNANVATGAPGLADAREVRGLAAALAGVDPARLLIASTGVIGVRYPMGTLREAIPDAGPLGSLDPGRVAAAIMTTDTHPKVASRRVGGAVVCGVAKGVGMIEPDMATLLTFFVTDAAVPAERLAAIFARVVGRSFNRVSIDTDTSTSDTAAIVASGAAGPVDEEAFEDACLACALELVKQVARDGEGASKLIEVTVSGARDEAQAVTVAKSIVNSPLVKTAVHGADPNWGRVAMAIGKVDDADLDPDRVTIGFGDQTLYPAPGEAPDLARLSRYLGGDEVLISAGLGLGEATATVYGCDLTEGYIRINADYTT